MTYLEALDEARCLEAEAVLYEDVAKTASSSQRMMFSGLAETCRTYAGIYFAHVAEVQSRLVSARECEGC